MRRGKLSLMVLIALAAPASALWSSDPALNFAICDRSSEQTVPKIAARSDGGCYVGWFDAASGNYDVYLQRLDALGNEAWAHDGILVSGHPQDSWITEWDLLCDSDGNAVLVFNDIRAGGDWDIYAYKVSPEGGMLWGADGIALSNNTDSEPSPKVVEASDGDLVFVWSRDTSPGSIMMQRLAPDGTPRLAVGGITVVTGDPGTWPGACVMCPADAGSVVVAWLRDISYMGNRYFFAQKFDAAGTSSWGAPVAVCNQTSLPMGYEPHILSDGAGGAILLWHRYYSGLYNSCVQHLDASGTELFAHNGLTVSTNASMYHIDPTMALSGSDLYVFWDERDTGQSQWGIVGQRFDAVGNRLWGASGRMFLPTNTLFKWALRALPATGGAMVFWFDEQGGYGSDRLHGFRVDSDGDFLWPGDIVDVATTPSVKGRLPVTQGPDGTALLIWTDERGGSPDIYGQNVRLDGSLGGDGTGIPEAPATARLICSYPNPFNPKTTLRFELAETASIELAVYDASGSLLAVLAEGVWGPGRHELIWDGLDARGRVVPSGLYLATLRNDRVESTLKLIMLR